MKVDSRLSELTGVKDIMRAAGLLEWLHEEYCTHQELIQAIATHRLDAAPYGINCCSCHDNTIGQNYFTIPISDEEKENIFWDNTSCNTQPVTYKQRGINDDIDVSTVNANNLIGFSLYKFAPGNYWILFHRFRIQLLSVSWLCQIHLNAESHSLQGQGCPRHHRCSHTHEPLLYLNHKYMYKEVKKLINWLMKLYWCTGNWFSSSTSSECYKIP